MHDAGIAGGQSWDNGFPQKEVEQLLQSKLSGLGLTRQPVAVAVFGTQGLSNREIADRLFIAEQSVKDHIHDVFTQLKITQRSELILTLLGLCPSCAIRQKMLKSLSPGVSSCLSCEAEIIRSS